MSKRMKIAALTVITSIVITTLSVLGGQGNVYATGEYCGVTHAEVVDYMALHDYQVLSVKEKPGCILVIDTQYTNHVQMYIDGGKIVAIEEMP